MPVREDGTVCVCIGGWMERDRDRATSELEAKCAENKWKCSKLVHNGAYGVRKELLKWQICASDTRGECQRRRQPKWGDNGDGSKAWLAGQRLELAAAAAIVTYNNYMPVSTHTWPFKWATAQLEKTYSSTHRQTDGETRDSEKSQPPYLFRLPPTPTLHFDVFDIKTKCRRAEMTFDIAASRSNPLPV